MMYRLCAKFTLIGLIAILVSPLAGAERSAELHLLLEGTERFQKNILDLEADVLQLEQDLQYPAESRASVFLNTALGGRYSLERLELVLDGRPLLEQQYNAAQRRALAEGATQPLHVMSLAPGEHELEARFTVREGKKLHRGRSRLAFSQGEGETWLELLIEDVPGEIYTTADAGNGETPQRQLELSARAWEAPR